MVLGIYGAFLVVKLAGRQDSAGIRLGMWLAFSIVFFTQFILGIGGYEHLLMTGRLHTVFLGVDRI